MGRSVLPTCDVLGVSCVVADVGSATEAVIARALSGDGGYAVLCNAHVLTTARRESAVMGALDAAWAVFPDGAPIAWAQRRLGHAAASRVGGPDLMADVLAQGRSHGLRHALFGSTPLVVQALAQRMENSLPGLDIVDAYAPAQGEEESGSLLERIAATRPHVVWCALGAPKQELWMARRAAELAPSLVLGVGAAFDFHAGHKQRAPLWMQHAGLEWLHRLASEPRRLGGRYLRTDSQFVFDFLASQKHRAGVRGKT